jgi:hypothetical protein
MLNDKHANHVRTAARVYLRNHAVHFVNELAVNSRVLALTHAKTQSDYEHVDRIVKGERDNLLRALVTTPADKPRDFEFTFQAYGPTATHVHLQYADGRTRKTVAIIRDGDGGEPTVELYTTLPATELLALAVQIKADVDKA